MPIPYQHSLNTHTVEGPLHALPILLADLAPRSLLDVGCGTGTWLSAARQLGIADVYGIDGVAIPAQDLLIPSQHFACVDLTQSWDLGRKFDLALCLFRVRENAGKNILIDAGSGLGVETV